MTNAMSPETRKITLPTAAAFFAAFIALKILYEFNSDNKIVNEIGQAIRSYLPVLEKRYNYSHREFGLSSANWQVTFMAGMILVCVGSFFHSLLVRFSRRDLRMIYSRYAPTKSRSVIALIMLSAATFILFVSIVFVPWMPRLISESRLHGPLYRVVPNGISWSNGWDALLLYMASQAGVFIRGVFVIMRPPQRT